MKEEERDETLENTRRVKNKKKRGNNVKRGCVRTEREGEGSMTKIRERNQE